MHFEEQIKALSKISKAITSELYLEDILRLIVTVIAELLGSNICSLMLVDEKSGQLVVRATQSISEEYYKHKDIARREGLSSLLCVPMAVKGKVIGVINCYTSKPHEFSEEEIEILTTIANQAAVAIENTELMVKSKIIQEELENRKRVERAKGILMRDENLTEEQAYLKIRKYSMDNRKTMREVAEAIILAADMKHLTGAR
jgi:GAF domain-containing protein